MQPTSIEILERHKEHWFTLSKAGYCKNLEYEVKKEIESVVQAELDPHYHENLWCSECIANMIRRIYTQYDKFLESQLPNPETFPHPEMIVPAKPKEEPIAAPSENLKPQKGKRKPKP